MGRPSRRRRGASSRGGQAMSAFGTTTPADGAMVYTDCSSAVSGPGKPRGGHSQRGRVRPGNRSTWAYSPPFWNGSRPPSPFHSRRRRFPMRHQVVSLPALSCLCAVVPSCCLSPAATTPASRPTRLRWLSAPHRYWRSSPSRQSPSSIVSYRLLVYETVRDRFPGLRGGQPVRIGRRDGLLTGMDGIRVASCAGAE